MSLSSGTRIGVYEIVAPLGAGGMGMVYRARDTHLERCKEYAANPTRLLNRVHRALIYALQQKPAAAAEIAAGEVEAEKAPRALPFHDITYGIARVRARLGDAARALHWLQITADSGWPAYPMMARDHMLDPIRNDPAIAKFLASLKKTWENNRREFGTEDQ